MDKPLDKAAVTAGPLPDDESPPQPPTELDLDACCGQGCDPCIFDLFADAQQRYRAEVAAWQARRAARSGH